MNNRQLKLLLVTAIGLALVVAAFWLPGAWAQGGPTGGRAGTEGRGTPPDGNADAPLSDCVSDDSFEDNDSLGGAAPITAGSYGPLALCGDDADDYYAVQVPAGHTLHAELVFSHGGGDIDLILYDPAGLPVGGSGSTTDNEAGRVTVAEGGTYYVLARFVDSSGSNSYSMHLAVSCRDCFSYQGRLVDGGMPAQGSYELQFTLYDGGGPAGQPLGGSITRTIPVSNGLFTADLYFGPTAATYGGANLGRATYLQVGARPAGSGDPFTTLSPRQPLTPAPVAHTLQPGAVISGGLQSSTLTLRGGQADGLAVLDAGSSGVAVYSGTIGVYVHEASSDGVQVRAAGSPSTTIRSTSANGVEVGGAEGDGLFVGRADRYGAYVKSAGNYGMRIDSAGFDGVWVLESGSDGLSVSSAGQNGLYVGSAGLDGVSVFEAGSSGYTVFEAARNGFYVGEAGEDGIRICAAGGEPCDNWSDFDHGVEVGTAKNDGLHVIEAGGDGLQVCATGSQTGCAGNGNNHGVEIGNSEHDGVHITNAGVDGLDVESAGGDGVQVRSANNLAGDFNGDVDISGTCTGCNTAVMAVNESQVALAPGDTVASAGTLDGAEVGQQLLLEVVPAAPGGGVVGVVDGRAELVQETRTGGTVERQLVPREGPAAPGEYVTVVIYGPVQVRADVTATEAAGSLAGRRLAAGSAGVRPLRTTVVDGLTVAEDVPSVGLALEAEPDANGMLWVLVNPQ